MPLVRRLRPKPRVPARRRRDERADPCRAGSEVIDPATLQTLSSAKHRAGEHTVSERSRPSALAAFVPSRVRIRMRSDSTSVTMARTFNSSRPTRSVGSCTGPPRLSEAVVDVHTFGADAECLAKDHRTARAGSRYPLSAGALSRTAVLAGWVGGGSAYAPRVTPRRGFLGECALLTGAINAERRWWTAPRIASRFAGVVVGREHGVDRASQKC